MTLDCLIVLGAKVNPEGRPGRIARMRLVHALKVWLEQGQWGHILLTGGPTQHPGLTEAQAMADFAVDWARAHLDRPACRRLLTSLLVEEESRNTLESARNTLPILLELQVRTVGLVSDALHLPRAKYVFCRIFKQEPITLTPLPVPGVLRHYWQNRRYFWLTKMLLRETGAWLKVLGRNLAPRRPPL